MANKMVMYAVYASVGLMVAFLLFGSVLLPQFSDAWRYCQTRRWVGAHGDVETNCTRRYGANFNTTEVTGSTHAEGGLTSDVAVDNTADAYCLNCDVAGGYRTTVQGLVLLLMVIGAISVAWIFI